MAVFMYPVSKDLWDSRELSDKGMMFLGKGDYGAFGNGVFSPVQGVVDKVVRDDKNQSAAIILHKGEQLFSFFYPLDTKTIEKFIKSGDAIDAGHQIGIVDGKILMWQVGKIGEKDSWVSIPAWMSTSTVVPLTPGGGANLEQVGPKKPTDWTWPALIAGALYLWSQAK